VQALREDVLPWLRAHVPVTAEHQARLEAEARVPRCTVLFDREGYSPDLFLELQKERMAALTYHRYPKGDGPPEEFQDRAVTLWSGETVRMKWAEREVQVGKRPGLRVREVRKLAPDGRQISIVSTNRLGDAASQAAALLARWSQENFFKYRREPFGLDALVQYGTEEIPATVTVLKPVWRELNRQVRKQYAELKRCRARPSGAPLNQPLSAPAIRHDEQQQGQLQETIEQIERFLEDLQKQRKATAHQIPVKDLPAEDRFTRLRTERKQFLDTIKMIAYRAETAMAATIREKLARWHDARALLRQIYQTEVDLLPDLPGKILTVPLHHLTQSAHDEAVRYLCEELTATQTVFPGTDLQLVYKLGST
jgi:hypothetical protein